MKTSKKIRSRQNQLKFYTNSNVAKQSHACSLTVGSRKTKVHFNQNDDIIYDLAFSGELGEGWTEIFDLYLELLQAKSIERIKKISLKELDYYLRDDPKQQLFDYYPDELLHILSLPRVIEEYLQEGAKSKQPFYQEQLYGKFINLPYGMKIELLEDFFSELPGQPWELVDMEDDVIQVKSSSGQTAKELEELLCFHFGDKLSILVVR